MVIRLAASLAAAPMVHLAGVVEELEAGGVDVIHFDVEDGAFTPMMTLGTRIISELRSLTELPFDVHLAMRNPEWLIPEVISDGADWVSVHWEACAYPHRVLRLVRDQGARAGLAFNPKTPLPDLRYLQECLDYVLLLTTEPEYPSAAFLPEVLHKLRQGKPVLGQNVGWQVDGGISEENIGRAVRAGATTVVAGRSVFRDNQVSRNLRSLRRAVLEAVSV